MIGRIWTKATNDGGVYYIEEGVLCYAPKNVDGSVAWDGGAQVAFDCIDEFLIPEAKRAEDILRGSHCFTLCDEWNRWCQFEGLEAACAEELLHRDITHRQREYVEAFIVAWDQRVQWNGPGVQA